MNEEDFDKVINIELACFPCPWSLQALLEEIESPGQYFYVAEENSSIIGYIGLHIEFWSAYILSIVVIPEYRRQKVATKLLKYVIDQFAFLQIINLDVRESNHAAIQFYQSMGFAETGIRTIKYYYDTDDDALQLSLHLDRDLNQWTIPHMSISYDKYVELDRSFCQDLY